MVQYMTRIDVLVSVFLLTFLGRDGNCTLNRHPLMIDKPERDPKNDGNTDLTRYEVPEEQKKAYEQMFGRSWYPGAERFVDDVPFEIISEPDACANSDKSDLSNCNNHSSRNR